MDAVETVGVVGSDSRQAVDAFAAAGVATETGDAAAVLGADVDCVVAVGEAALLEAAREHPSVPVLPVTAGTGVRSVSADDLRPAAVNLAAGDATTEPHPLVGVGVDGDRVGLAVMDVMLVTAEPAHISEYGLSFAGESVAQFRADGVVAATPAGTGGYARTVGAPVIPPGQTVLAVEPVAPFATQLDHWVLPPPLEVTVERNDATVEVLVDDDTVATAGLQEPVTLESAGTVSLARVAESRSVFPQL